MKIQINSLAAMERLLDGDTELEMEVRRSVADHFAKSHLKGPKATAHIQTLLQNEMFDIVGTTYNQRKVLKADLKELVAKEVSRAVVEITKDIVDNHLDELVKARISQMLK